ncbi:putative rRNA methyltransferase YlbH [Lolium rigidum]|uniref:putative rRNA methyltransferase YlbH n=1 Tax=Lolium rigidum TaxID=89674 RepID=UPI001F5D9536|nr:putative rRNA methyltransferase YlbH [Lolium rigidum]XP_047092432.1 putative rRNA methyltransferase YlbH [Lolium rigidum]XP_047092433.1 putative rRNA methyltransferase YlbH [Lolium rigidum]XP_047092434.1 putative rRNA methyltransferase YlbH [Lolium rigidum]
MASSTLASSPFLPSLATPNHKRISLRLPARRLPVAASAAPKGAAAAEAARERRRFLERYGLNPDDYEEDTEPDPREERRRERRMRKSGRGEEGAAVAPARPVERRETHKMLQVLAGKVRRRKLLSPKDRNVRPMMEVVRGAAFDILQSAGGSPASLRPGLWLDLYSGTGSVGIEAMSRGCSEAHFVEMDPWVISEVLKPNLDCTGFLGVSHIHMLRVENFLDNAEKSKGSGRYPSFDYISVTPPYVEVNYSTLLDQLARSPLVGEDCFILVEYPLKTDMPESCGDLIKIADRRFGRTNLLIYGPTWSEKKKGQVLR